MLTPSSSYMPRMTSGSVNSDETTTVPSEATSSHAASEKVALLTRTAMALS